MLGKHGIGVDADTAFAVQLLKGPFPFISFAFTVKNYHQHSVHDVFLSFYGYLFFVARSPLWRLRQKHSRERITTWLARYLGSSWDAYFLRYGTLGARTAYDLSRSFSIHSRFLRSHPKCSATICLMVCAMDSRSSR